MPATTTTLTTTTLATTALATTTLIRAALFVQLHYGELTGYGRRYTGLGRWTAILSRCGMPDTVVGVYTSETEADAVGARAFDDAKASRPQ